MIFDYIYIHVENIYSYIYYINIDMLFGAPGEPLKEYKLNADTTTAREVSSTNNNFLINIKRK